MDMTVMLRLFVVLMCTAFTRSQEAEYFDVFGTGLHEWRIAFRGASAINESVWAAYSTAGVGGVAGAGCRKVHSVKPCYHHWRNDEVLDDWTGIDEVAFVVYKASKMVAYVTFDGKGSDNLSWFDQGRLLTTSWTDIRSDIKNQFS